MSFGSRRWFQYTTDLGDVYAKDADESNTELVNPTAQGSTIPTGAVRLPSEFACRRVKMKSGGGSSKTVPVLTRARYDAIDLGQAFAAPSVGEENAPQTSFVVVQKIPERILRAPIPLDTGKNDGDQP